MAQGSTQHFYFVWVKYFCIIICYGTCDTIAVLHLFGYFHSFSPDYKLFFHSDNSLWIANILYPIPKLHNSNLGLYQYLSLYRALCTCWQLEVFDKVTVCLDPCQQPASRCVGISLNWILVVIGTGSYMWAISSLLIHAATPSPNPRIALIEGTCTCAGKHRTVYYK